MQYHLMMVILILFHKKVIIWSRTSVVDVYLEHFTEELTVLKLVQVATDLKLGQTFHKKIFL